MDHSFGDMDLFPTSYQDHPVFSPNPFQQLEREDFATGIIIIQPDPSNSQFPAATQTPNPNPSMDHSFSSEPLDLEQFNIEDLLGDKDDDDDDDSNGGAQPAHTDPAEDTAPTPMEIARLEEVAPLQVNGYQGAHPAGGVGASTDIGMGKPQGSSMQTDRAGLINQPAPCSGDIDLSTATEREILDHVLELEKQRKDNGVVTKFDDDLVRLEPWKLPVHKQDYWATSMLGLDNKTLDGGCWKEAEFRGIRRFGPYGEKMPLMRLKRTLEFHNKDGTKTKWRMDEWISLLVSDGHTLLENNVVHRFLFQRPRFPPFNSNLSRIIGEGEEDKLENRCCILNGDCSHHHHSVHNNQAPSPSGKRPRSDDDPNKKTKLNVWEHFARIYIRIPNEAGSKNKNKNKNKKDGKKLVYAVCNYCDKVFKADTKQGTSHHGRHTESCLRKHSHPSSSKSCSQDIPVILEASGIVSAGGCGSGMLCV